MVVILNRELICALGCFENAALGFTGAEGTWGGELGVGVTSVPVVVLTPITSGSVCRKIVSSELIYLPPRKQKRKTSPLRDSPLRDFKGLCHLLQVPALLRLLSGQTCLPQCSLGQAQSLDLRAFDLSFSLSSQQSSLLNELDRVVWMRSFTGEQCCGASSRAMSPW